jgi:hypothetical protein
MLDQNLTQPNELIFFMNHYSIELQFKETTTLYNTHIDHIWTNATIEQCMLWIIETYYTNHRPINFAFKLQNYVSQYHHISWILIFSLHNMHTF